MPIRLENKNRYPRNWKEISLRIRDRAGNRCEQCGVGNGAHVERLGGRLVRVVLTVAHMDHQPENCADENLKALCQKCHLNYDRFQHAATSRKTREQKTGQGSFDV